MNLSYDRLGLVGRLGNALFELAATAGIAHTVGVEPRFNSGWLHRPYFSVPPQYFTDDFSECVPAYETDAVADLDDRSKVYLQDVSLFVDIMPTIRQWLAPSSRAQEVLNGPTCAEFRALPRPILAVHVRRGDNVYDPGTPEKHLWHPVPPLVYYQRGVEMLAPGVASVAVFGDDPEWNKTNIPGDYHHVGVVRPKEHEPDYLTAEVSDWIDWQLMARGCDRFVLSNSTFGIMSAHVSSSADVVYPWPVFGPKLRYINASLLFAAGWQRLNYARLH